MSSSDVFVSWSGGKDSVFSAYEAIRKGYNVSYLLNFIREDGRSYHGFWSDLLVAQSNAIGIPILQIKTTWEGWEEKLKNTMRELKQEGIEGAVFGDECFIEHKEWVENICNELKVRPLLPLWGNKPMELLSRYVNDSVKAIIVAVNPKLSKEWLGRTVDEEFLDYLRDNNIRPCTDAGEYHTFVVDGPMFKRYIKIVDGKKVKVEDGWWFLDVLKYEVVEKE